MKIRTTALIIATLYHCLTYIHLLIYKTVVGALKDCCKVEIHEYIKFLKTVLDA